MDPASAQPAPRPLWLGPIVFLLALLPYAQTFSFDFINYDDQLYVTDNTFVKRGLTRESILWAFTSVKQGGNYHPLTWLSHELDSTLTSALGISIGDPGSAALPHLHNALLHALAAWFLYRFLRASTGYTTRSAVAAILFAVHPLRVESVAWVAERKDVLSACFAFATMWAYVLYVRRGASVRGPHYSLVFVLYVLGLLAKPMLVTLPVLMLLLDHWPLRRTSWSQTIANDASRVASGKTDVTWETSRGVPPTSEFPATKWPKLIGEKLPLLALSLASCVLTILAQSNAGAVRSFERAPLLLRLGNAIIAYGWYLWRTLVPAKLIPLYPLPQTISIASLLIATLALIAITTFVVAQRTPRPYLPVAWLWYLGALVPVIGLVQVGEQAYADRYSYLPTAALITAAVWLASDWLLTRLRRPELAAALVVLLVIVWSLLSFVQAGRWRDSVTLFEYAVKTGPQNWLVNYNLGQALLAEQGAGDARERTVRSIDAFERALKFKPDSAETHNNLGQALFQIGRVDEAIAHYKDAIRHDPRNAAAYTNLGAALSSTGKVIDGVTHYRIALSIDETYLAARYNLAIDLVKLKQFDDAIDTYGAVINAVPHFQPAWRGLGEAYLGAGRTEEAATALRKAIELNPGDATAAALLARATAGK